MGPSGCEERALPSIQYHTERAAIGTGFDEPLCGADLGFIDRHIEFVESMLDVRHEETVEIYLFDALDELPCEQPAFGCFDEDEGYLAAVWDAVDHEIVHAITPSIPYPSLFWEEGVAGALSIEGTHDNPLRALDPAELDAEREVDYSTSAHFVRFLMDTRPEMAVARALEGEDLATSLGVDGAGLVAEYESAAPYAYPPWDPCPYPEIPETASETWAEELQFSCDSPDATQFEWSGANVVRRLELPEAGTYDITVAGGEGVLMVGCQTDVLDEPPPDFSHGDVMNQAELFQTAFGTFFDAEMTHRLELTSGVYRLALSSGTNSMATLSVDIRRVE